jgi:superfamily II DNA or RNA helicase
MMKLRDYQTAELDNVRSAFSHGSRRVIAVLPCGAGKTVLFAYMASRHCQMSPSNHVLFLVHRRELVEQAEETFDRFGIDRSRVHIAMAQTVSNHLESEPTPTFIVADEFHHYTASTFRRIIDRWPDAPLVGLTATPARLDGNGLGSVADDMVVGITAERLISQGWLAEYDYYAPAVSIAGAGWKARGADFDQEDVASRMEGAKIFGDVGKYLDFARKTIIYAPTVDFSQRLARQIGEKAAHFDGDTPKAERRRIMDGFRDGSIRVLCNCNLIGEGVDVPDCDCVMLLRPTMSVSLYIQQSMRCLRPMPGKRAVIYDFVGNVFRHGMPTADRQWSLQGKMKAVNPSGEKDITVRQCENCLRVYSGTSPICPYCGHDNGKTREQIRVEEKARLEKIQAVEKVEEWEERRRCYSYKDLLEFARRHGYKNPAGWAYHVYQSRKKH